MYGWWQKTKETHIGVRNMGIPGSMKQKTLEKLKKKIIRCPHSSSFLGDVFVCKLRNKYFGRPYFRKKKEFVNFEYSTHIVEDSFWHLMKSQNVYKVRIIKL